MKARRLDVALFGLAVLLLWQGLNAAIGDDGISSPRVTLVHTAELLATKAFWGHAAASGKAFVFALAVALLGGLAIGLLLGFFTLAGEVFEPIVGAVYSIPKITLYPVILLIFGLSLSAKVAFGALHGIFPVIIFTVNGINNIRRSVLKTATVLRMGSGQTMWRIMLPAALPEIFSGFRIGFSLTLLGTLIAELFAADSGLGFVLIRSIERHDVPTIMALTLLLIAVSAAVGTALLRIDRRIRSRY